MQGETQKHGYSRLVLSEAKGAVTEIIE